MKGNGASQELRNEIQTLAQAREALQSNADISGSMVKVNRTMNKIQPLMDKQTEYIKTFLQANETSDVSSKQAEIRRYVARISDITLNEMGELFAVGDKYFTLDAKSSWAKLRNKLEKDLQENREKTDKNSIIQFMFRIMNMRDQVTKDFIKSMLYRKCLLWKDMNITYDGFVHAEKKKITKSIQDYIYHEQHAPTRPRFPKPRFDVQGQWSLNTAEVQEASLSEFLGLLDIELEEVFGSLRNYSNLNEEQRSEEIINRNKLQVKSLRGEIEQGYQNYQVLERKYREAVSKDEKMDMVEMKEKLKLVEEALENKEVELKELKFSYRDYTRDMTTMKDKIKELQADLDKVTKEELKKLKEVEVQQGALSEEFKRIHKNVSNFGGMFEFESEGKKNLAHEIILLKETISKMADILGRHKREIQTHKDEIKRLNAVIIDLGLEIRRLKGGGAVG